MGLPPTRRGGKGWGLQGRPHLQGLAGRLTGLSTCLWLVSSQLRWVTARSRDAREGGPLLRSPHDPSCALLPSRVSRVSLPPATKGRTMTVTRTPVLPGKLIRDLAPSWGLVTWCSLPSPSKMPVSRRGAWIQHEPRFVQTAQVQGAAPNGRREGLDQGRELLTSCISFPGQL